MRISPNGIDAARLDLAGAHSFTEPGAGPGRRAAIGGFLTDWLDRVWAEATDGQAFAGVALGAVGSLGRGDAGPLSDLDLVLLHDGRSLAPERLTALADRVWYPIWDANVRLDHSVRTFAQCRSIAAADLSAAVGLLDVAPIAGDRELVAAIRSTLAHDWRAQARKRLPQLLDSLRERHDRHGELAQSIEPDLKDARGGLRDMTVLRALVAAWLTDRPHGEVDQAYAALLDVRDALQVVTGRGRDRLGREEHDAVAALAGYRDADELMTMVSRSGRALAYALDATMRRAGQSQRARTLRVGPRRPTMVGLGYGVFEHDGEAVLGAAPSGDVTQPIRTAVVAARAGLGLSPQTLANLADIGDLPVPWPEPARDLFTDLLATGAGLPAVWSGLTHVGLVERWLPEWAAVDSRPQRNPIHRHTVDRHLIETVVAAGAFVREVARPDLLLLAALLHDIGKVAGAHDHSVTGAMIARPVLARMGVADADAEIVVLLVREHLTLMELATRRDLTDPDTAAAAWAAAGEDPDVFDLLRYLSIADAKAAGGLSWNDWRARLFEQLCAEVGHAGRARTRSVACPEAVDLPDDVLTCLAVGEPVVAVSQSDGAYRIASYDRDRLGLFADTAGLFAAQGLTVRSAVLRTLDAVAANEWIVEVPGADAPSAARLALGLAVLARGERAPLASLERRRTYARSAAVMAAGMPTRAFALPDAASDATVLEVRTRDRLGLLHDLGRCFAKAGLTVRCAYIATYAGQTLDTFYLTEASGAMLSPSRVSAAVAAVLDSCDS